MRKVTFPSVLFIFYLFLVSTSQLHAQGYWIPHVDLTPGNTNFISQVSIQSLQNTIVGFDHDHDGKSDATKALPANTQLTIDVPDLVEGTYIQSTAPLKVVYQYRMVDNGTYEDGGYFYGIPSEDALGTDYWVPLSGTELVILATKNNTVINVGNSTVTIDKGETHRVMNPVAGMNITGSEKIMVVVLNYEENRYDQTFACTLMPTASLDQTYYIPREHSAALNELVSSSRIEIVAIEDQTTVTIGGISMELNSGGTYSYPTSAETAISSDKPLGAAYIFDVEALDPWSQTRRRYTYAHSLLPSALSNTSYVVGPTDLFFAGHGGPSNRIALASLADNNQVMISVHGNQISEQSITLNKGEFHYYDEISLPQWNEQAHISIEAQDNIQVISSYWTYWNNIAESGGAHLIFPVNGDSHTEATQHTYWVPMIDALAGSNATESKLFIHATEASVIEIDWDNDGNPDRFEAMESGAELIINVVESMQGASIRSSSPISAYYFFRKFDNNAYEDGAYTYNLVSEDVLGADYWLTSSMQQISIVAIEDNTSLALNGNQLANLSKGEVYHYPSPTAGTHITSSKNIMVVAANFASDKLDSTTAFTLPPTNRLSTTYYVPEEHPYNYANAVSSSRVELVAAENETEVAIGGTSIRMEAGEVYSFPTAIETTIQSNKPISATYFSEIEGRDPWKAKSRKYTYAHPLIPQGLAGNSFVIEPSPNQSNHGTPELRLAITSYENDNQINFDVGLDGAMEQTITLSQGETHYISERTFANWNRAPLQITSTTKIQVIYSFRNWWNQISERASAQALYGTPTEIVSEVAFFNSIPNNSAFNEPIQLWKGQTNTSAKVPIKICADGSKATIVQFINKTDVPNENIGFRLASFENTTSDWSGEFADQYQIEQDIITTFFTHPQYMDENGLYRTDEFRVIDTRNDEVIYSHPVEIYRAPILMVHGLWGERKNFDTFEKKLREQLYPKTLTFRADYSENDQNAASFAENSNVVAESLNQLFYLTRKEGYSTSKADVIAHSMGGIISRVYLQKDKCLEGPKGDNCYRDDIHKFITVNTPHAGSQAANYILSSSLNGGVELAKLILTIDQKPFDKGAVRDLAIGSSAITELNLPTNLSNNKVPSFALTTTDAGFVDGNNIKGTERILIFFVAKDRLQFTSVFLEELFDNEPSDLIVALSSQIGQTGTGQKFIHHPDIVHTRAIKEEIIFDDVISLLNANPNDGRSFITKGFSPPVLKSNFRTNERIQRNVSNDELPSPKGFIKITKPINGEAFETGDFLTVSLDESTTNTLNFSDIMLIIHDRENGTIGIDTTSLPFSYTYKIPKGGFGKLNFTAIGLDTIKNEWDFDTLSVRITPSAILDSISFYPNLLFKPIEKPFSLSIFGHFSDSTISNLSSLNEVHFQVLDTSTLVTTSSNEFVGKKIGVTEVIATYRNISVRIPIEFYEGQTQTTTNFSKQLDTSFNNPFTVYPNPFSDNIHISFDLITSQNTSMQVFDLSGRLVQNIWLNQTRGVGQHNLLFNGSLLNEGFYIIRLTTQNGIWHQKILKSN